MSDRDSYPPGVPCWTAVLGPDPTIVGAFYAELLGWELTGPEGSREFPYYVGTLRGRPVAGIGSLPEGAAPMWTTHVRVDRVEDALEAVTRAGGTVIAGPLDSPDRRMGVFTDAQGALLCVSEDGPRDGAQVVNEPGAWAMSALQTSEADAAGAFYGAVFGWETESFAPGVSMVRLPGYVGGEPEQPVPRDVVAVLATGEGAATWGVDFWVHDADATAALAAERGGTVLVAPHDVPMFRSAVLADPWGAAFSVSQLVA